MKKVLALIVLCFIAFNSHAQLRYQNGYLVYNAMERYNGYMTNWEGWAHCWKFGDRMILKSATIIQYTIKGRFMSR